MGVKGTKGAFFWDYSGCSYSGLQGHQTAIVSVNICSVEGNSAGIFVTESVTWNFRNKEEMNAYYFRKG